MSSFATKVRRFASRAVALATLLAAAVPAFAQQEAPPGMSQFTAVKNLPPAQRMADGPLFVVVYAVIWVLLLLFLWMIWRRLAKIDGDLRRVEGSRK